MKVYEEYEEIINYKKIILVIVIPVIAIIVGLIYFGVIPLNFRIETPIEEEPIIEVKPVEDVPIITEIDENPIFVSSSEEGLIPTTPQIFNEKPNLDSLEPTTPQQNIPAQSGNLDDIEPKYRRFLEHFPIDQVLYIQNTPCSELTEEIQTTYQAIIGEKGC